MCTLIAGVEVLGPRTLVLGANRDESPERAAAPPGILRERPRVVGGRDLVAGGTWLAVREARAVTALMNRRPTPGAAPPAGGPAPRSRGLLCLDAAALGGAPDQPHRIDPGTGERHPARLHAALALIDGARDAYAACTLVGLNVDEPSWAILAETGRETGIRILEPGWNVVTHADVNDVSEPRTAWLRSRLESLAPRTVDEALRAIAALLVTHEDAGHSVPGVCLHRDRFPTVSSSLIALGDLGSLGPQRYLHAPGPPCSTPYADLSSLFA
ncbi:MAG TPA: NRDE family protein [Candidatus Omnitrophota bacterium]|nr:NRDE family protein [Candidatus Omnitrophota bacterium]